MTQGSDLAMFSPPVRWLLTATLVAAAIATVSTSDSHTTVRARTCTLAHAVLCTAMIAMLWPFGAGLAAQFRAFVLACVTTWFLALALNSRPWPQLRQLTRWEGLATLHHAVMAAAMTWMVLDMPGGHHSMPAAMPEGVSGLAAALGGYFMVAALPWLYAATGTQPSGQRRRGVHAAGNAAMSAGMGVLLLAQL
jgi:hypothetical protein